MKFSQCNIDQPVTDRQTDRWICCINYTL